MFCCFSYTTEAVEVSAKLLEANPEFYTAWNYRKLAVQNNLASAQSSDSDGSINSILDEELKVVSYYSVLCFFVLGFEMTWIP